MKTIQHALEFVYCKKQQRDHLMNFKILMQVIAPISVKCIDCNHSTTFHGKYEDEEPLPDHER